MDDSEYLQKKPNVKRRMEAQGQSSSGEMRRIHIIYFLSHKGRIEHPHLIRVHHLSRSGVRLQDVKRWLSELRGGDMPESYSWSYKRRYRTGYVWQDLVDEDLITPISDNEYVLKGSEIVHTRFDNDLRSFDENKVPLMQTMSHSEIEDDEEEDHTHSSRKPIHMSTQTSLGIEGETLKVELMKLQDKDKHVYDTNRRQSQKFENSVSSLYSILLNKKSNKRTEHNSSKEKSSTMNSSILSSSSSSLSSSWSCSPSSFTKSKSYSGGTSQMFRNLMTCGATDTNDSATVMINRRGKSRFNVPSNSKSNDSVVEICKAERLGGSEKKSGTSWSQHYHHHDTW